MCLPLHSCQRICSSAVSSRWYNKGFSLFPSAEDNQPYLSVPCSDYKITSAVWGPLGEFVIAGHENGEINQFSAKVPMTSKTHLILIMKPKTTHQLAWETLLVL